MGYIETKSNDNQIQIWKLYLLDLIHFKSQTLFITFPFIFCFVFCFVLLSNSQFLYFVFAFAFAFALFHNSKWQLNLHIIFFSFTDLMVTTVKIKSKACTLRKTKLISIDEASKLNDIHVTSTISRLSHAPEIKLIFKCMCSIYKENVFPSKRRHYHSYTVSNILN